MNQIRFFMMCPWNPFRGIFKHSYCFSVYFLRNTLEDFYISNTAVFLNNKAKVNLSMDMVFNCTFGIMNIFYQVFLKLLQPSRKSWLREVIVRVQNLRTHVYCVGI